MSDKREPRYSGPNRSGICICGHSWDDHHLGIVMNRDYNLETGEAYIAQECEHFGFNETGGMEYKDGNWVDHCYSYEDSMTPAQFASEQYILPKGFRRVK